MIRTTGISRKVDGVGRVVLPMDAREFLGIQEGDSLEVLLDTENSRILLQKSSAGCLRCGADADLKEIKPGFYLCQHCLDELR